MDQTEISFLPDEQKKDLCLDLLSEFGADQVRASGHELRHNCTLPMGGHTDNNSFAASINYKKLSFNCYVCGYGGSLAWWIATNRRQDVDQIEPWLKKKLGLGTSLPLAELIRVLDGICGPQGETRILPTYPEAILNRWALTEPLEYLTKREIPEETVERFRLGYAEADDDWSYHKRLIVPVFQQERLVGWQARLTTDATSSEDPKYKNSTDFPRDRALFTPPGENLRSWNYAVVVESPFSVLRHAHHLPMVATFGSNLTDTQLRLLERFRRIVVCNENDKAGLKMTRRILARLSRSTIVDVWQNPYNGNVDPADLDDDTFAGLVEDALPGALWEPRSYDRQIPYIKE